MGNILYPIFQATYIAQRLLKNDNKLIEYFEKASIFIFGKSLCILFTTLLVYGGITNVVTI